jgi:spore coat protein U-like protein
MNATRAGWTKARLALLVTLVALLHAPLAAALVSCTTSASGVSFGVYNPLSAAPNVANGSLSITCSLLSGLPTNVPFSVSLSTGGSGTYAPRRLVTGSYALGYNLYSSATYTQIWGDGTGGSFFGTGSMPLTLPAPTRTVSVTMYGRIPAAQDVGPGSYADSIIVTVSS